jgi:ribonuclease E
VHGENDSGPRPEQTFAHADELIAPPSTEPELKEAVADLDAAPPEPRAPIRAEATPPSVPVPEPTRRRSTVREKAPVGGSVAAPPSMPSQSPSAAPEPVVTEIADAADGDRPRRTGWWSRRFAGS